MTLTVTIPIKKYLIKFLSPNSWDNIFKVGEDLIPLIFTHYKGYIIKQKELRDLYFENKLFKGLNKNQMIPKNLAEYKDKSYLFLRFRLPVRNKICNELITEENKEINAINESLDFYFWEVAIREVFLRERGSVNKAIDIFYEELNLTNKDFDKIEFKTLIYRLKYRRKYKYLFQ